MWLAYRCFTARGEETIPYCQNTSPARLRLVNMRLSNALTYRDLEEIMAERNLSVDHATIWRWVQRYAPVLNQWIRREIRRPNRSWRVDEMYLKIAGS